MPRRADRRSSFATTRTQSCALGRGPGTLSRAPAAITVKHPYHVTALITPHAQRDVKLQAASEGLGLSQRPRRCEGMPLTPLEDSLRARLRQSTATGHFLTRLNRALVMPLPSFDSNFVGRSTGRSAARGWSQSAPSRSRRSAHRDGTSGSCRPALTNWPVRSGNGRRPSSRAAAACQRHFRR